ncbi:phytoene desaturase family protein [Methylobacterium sp. J-030]|uniref:phytoene desaturase family protein n=1 Tax=Methylobacterium sp. J-030 TaxID=2836627 RepID=UPI001FB9C2CD|nr:phytoene desaturase family protein [Methylobacterium sp. J-030]MCJ2069936.1 phytoene desaturase family protein [Methylobacterium sp. J-030]
MTQDSTVAVIGSGLGGLAAACVAAARGHRVTVYDKNGWLGGKAAVLHEGGFRFDMGPTILTVPRVLERIFAEAGRSVHDYMDLRRLDPQWRCFFDDGSHIDLMQDVERMAGDMERFAPGTGEGYKKFLSISEHLHSVSEKFFFWKPVEDLFDTINIRANMNPGTLRDVLSLRMHASVASTIRGKVKDARLAQMLDHFVQYVGSSPYGAPAVLCAIAHMQTADGVWYPMGGTRAVAEGLAKLAQELGATCKTDTEVTGIETANGAVRGVRTAEGVTPFDAVISNMDSVRTYRELVGGEAAKAYTKKNPEPACSGVVLYLGLNRRYEHLNHHDFVFSRDPEEEFDYIYNKGEPAPDPTAYLAAPSSTDPSVAPEGGEALYVLVHTPYLRPHHDWRPDGPLFQNYRRTILDKLKRTANMPDLEERIVVERHLTPQDIHERYRVLNGAIYGLASHGRVMGAFKPGNRSRQVRGLYLAGGAAHPGPGMPMVMMSGWIAADAHDQDARGTLRATA